MYGDYPVEEKRDRRDDPPVTIYLLNDEREHMDKLACMFCKRTICDFKGRVDKIVDVPIDTHDFGVAVNIRCKLCHQNWRLVMNPILYKAYIHQTRIEVHS